MSTMTTASPCNASNPKCLFLEHVDGWPWDSAFECLIHGELRAPYPEEKVKGRHPGRKLINEQVTLDSLLPGGS